MLQSLVNRYRPRPRIGTDPLLPVPEDQRFAPITVARLKLIRPLAREILRQRTPREFAIRHDRRLTVVIPVRNREEHLAVLVPALRQTLSAQGLDYRIVVAEQAQGKLFNKGKLMNFAARRAWEETDYFNFHDVDIIPEHAEYGCPSEPMRLATRLSSTWRGISKISGSKFGNLTSSITRDQFERVNGFCNDYWGWGKEDDDFFLRCVLRGLVPYEDRLGTFADLENPKEEMVQRPVMKRTGRNTRLKSMLCRNLRDAHARGLAEVECELLEERRDGDTWHLKLDV